MESVYLTIKPPRAHKGRELCKKCSGPLKVTSVACAYEFPAPALCSIHVRTPPHRGHLHIFFKSAFKFKKEKNKMATLSVS